MADLAQEWGSDLALAANGDLLLSSGTQNARERVLRRLLTNSLDYIWSPTYGAGLPRQIGETTSAQAIEATVRSQLFAEAAVDQSPPPIVRVTPIIGGVAVQITYRDTATGEPVALGFSLER